MKGSLSLGRISGIGIYVHSTFALLLAFIAITEASRGAGSVEIALSVLFIILIFACVLLHELGHALAAQRYGIQTRDITLLPIGGIARLERIPDKPSQELVVALAGPLVNVVIAAGLFAGLYFSRNLSSDGVFSQFLRRVMETNIFLVAFNMLPAFPMDGGRVLRAILATRLEYARATRIAAIVGRCMAVVFGLVGLYINPVLVLIAVFVWIGAGQEAAAVTMKSQVDTVEVSSAMLTDFRTLSPFDTLGDAVQLVLAGSQEDFPVAVDGQATGVLTRARLLSALAEGGYEQAVGAVMEPVPAVDSKEPLERAMGLMRSSGLRTVPVMNSGRLVGLLTLENIKEFLMVRSAIRSRKILRA